MVDRGRLRALLARERPAFADRHQRSAAAGAITRPPTTLAAVAPHAEVLATAVGELAG
jgi:hypothetical protein